MRVKITLNHPNSSIKNDKIDVYVNEEFLKKHPDILNKTAMEAVTGYSLFENLSNEDGPALMSQLDNNYRYYFINGKKLDPNSEELKSIKHKEAFNNGIEKLLK